MGFAGVSGISVLEPSPYQNVIRGNFMDAAGARSKNVMPSTPEEARQMLAEFEAKFKSTGAREIPARPKPDLSPATYVRFTYEPEDPEHDGKTYTHAVYLQTSKQGAERDDTAMRISKYHERSHVLQDFIEDEHGDMIDVPESFASPFNEATPFVMCIEDWVWTMVMAEGDAYATTAYLAAIEEIAYPERKEEIRERMRLQPVNLEDWDEALRGTQGDVQRAKQIVSTKWWDRIKEPDPGVEEKINLLNYYVRYAIWLYEISERLNPNFGHMPKEYVRIDREKVGRAMGGSFGPNTYGKNGTDQNFTFDPPITEMFNIEKRYDDLIIRQGGGRETKRTFEEARADHFDSDEEYVESSKNNVSWLVPGQNSSRQQQQQHQQQLVVRELLLEAA